MRYSVALATLLAASAIAKPLQHHKHHENQKKDVVYETVYETAYSYVYMTEGAEAPASSSTARFGNAAWADRGNNRQRTRSTFAAAELATSSISTPGTSVAAVPVVQEPTTTIAAVPIVISATSTSASTTSTSTRSTRSTTAAAATSTSASAATSTTAAAPISTTAAAATSTSAAASSSTAAASAAPTLVSTYQDIVLLHHNVHRANHSAPDLTWSSSLAQIALDEANVCIYAHNTTGGGGGYGQNIAAGVEGQDVSTIITTMMYNGEMAWYAGMYGQANPSFDNFEKWGHFSQIVWKGTTEIGCATVHCTGGLAAVSSNVAPYFTVCNYSPPGNMGGEYANNIGRPLGAPTVGADYGLAN